MENQVKVRKNADREWYCEICNTGRYYKLTGQFCHLKTKKHIRNFNEDEYRKKEWYCDICNNKIQSSEN